MVGLHLLVFRTQPLCVCSTTSSVASSPNFLLIHPFCAFAQVTDLANNASPPPRPHSNSSLPAFPNTLPTPLVFEFHNACFCSQLFSNLKNQTQNRQLCFRKGTIILTFFYFFTSIPSYSILGTEEEMRKDLITHKERKKKSALERIILQLDHLLSKGQARYTWNAPVVTVLYLIRLRVVGVTDAVGEEERESCGDVAPIAISEAGDAPSGAEISRFISSLLRRDTDCEK